MKNNKSVQLEGTHVYVAPATPAGKVLAEELKAQGAHVEGFVDNLKTGDNIVNDPTLLAPEDYIVVAEGAYQEVICSTLVQRGALAPQVLTVHQGHISQFHYSWRLRLKNLIHQAEILVLSGLISLIANLAPSRRVVYYTEKFIDNNTLVAWQYHCTMAPERAILVSKNISTISGNSYPIHSIDTLAGKLALIRAKCVVIDHEYHGKLFDVVRSKRPFIQIFHGLPYKFLAGNKHFKHINDRVFISSSDYFNELFFPRLFRAERYLALGYPRNDVFLQSPAERCWVNTPTEQLPQGLIERRGQLWVYMPTFRDNGAFEMPFSLEKMQSLCEQTKRSLVLKFHPFVAKQVIQMFELEGVEEHIVALPGLPNIFLYPTRMNIYPWLADAELLITDYSSVAFDFLLADKPMVFFQHDYDTYYQNRGAFTVPTEDFAAGPVVKNESELFACLAQIAESGADTERGKRIKLIEKLKIRTELACPQLVALTREIE
ncbi:MAG: putative glycosyl/glycerophosphate transferase [Idiomarinaceae bacterium HL-53]|nr:MAG: putative glycosyl/glycerophosphate transferase [Idiomarinaceae bacterium HL-53]CUS49431.1 CDP-glycerol glycerophosphotransferase, TagB/SpsB family [Idiomarinaceae bacterium HL-53]